MRKAALGAIVFEYNATVVIQAKVDARVKGAFLVGVIPLPGYPLTYY